MISSVRGFFVDLHIVPFMHYPCPLHEFDELILWLNYVNYQIDNDSDSSICFTSYLYEQTQWPLLKKGRF